MLSYDGGAASELILPLIVGFVVAAVSGYLAIRLVKLLVVSDNSGSLHFTRLYLV